ncbi:ELMO domain-containing protein [Caenorhabditis elegans]|nr:ELMO domain-containing protein [Caenorhabditis elegans]CTQ86564.1 ELMO domain-containing protein [Caenorhabditis elegans]|eukprot:NP_001299864.1 ELMO domain-containing protein C56G7.3 [Caenorhabditis elegans]
MDVTREPGSPTVAVAPETSLQDLYPLLIATSSSNAPPSATPTDDVTDPEVQVVSRESIDNRSTFNRIIDVCLCRPVKSQMGPKAYTDKTLILKLAQIPYDHENGTHWLLLSDYFNNVSRSLMTSSEYSHVTNPSRVGAHWVTVGFQSATPHTDFRGCGVLGLLQMHTFTQRVPANLLRAIVLLATTEPNDFPLAVVSINITSILLTQLKKGALDNFGNEIEGLYPFFSALHASAMCRFCSIYKSQKCTLANTQTIFSEITRQLEKSPLSLIMLLNPTNDELINTLL